MEFNKSGLDLFVFIGTLFTVFTVGAASLDGGDVIQFRNILRPYSTDGCSRFPDGIPL